MAPPRRRSMRVPLASPGDLEEVAEGGGGGDGEKTVGSGTETGRLEEGEEGKPAMEPDGRM